MSNVVMVKSSLTSVIMEKKSWHMQYGITYMTSVIMENFMTNVVMVYFVQQV